MPTSNASFDASFSEATMSKLEAKKRKNPYYVDNVKFLNEIIKFQEKCEAAEAAGKLPPRPNDYLGSCIWLIAEGFASKPSYRNYPHIEEMKGDAIENCSKALIKFDRTRTNPFAYFTQITYYAFLHRIGLEKKQLAIKHKLSTRTVIFDEHIEHSVDGEDHHVSTFDLDNSYMSDNAAAVDQQRADAKKKRQTKAKKKTSTSKHGRNIC